MRRIAKIALAIEFVMLGAIAGEAPARVNGEYVEACMSATMALYDARVALYQCIIRSPGTGETCSWEGWNYTQTKYWVDYYCDFTLM